MPKLIADLLSPETVPARQPHAAIVALLRAKDGTQAYTCDEIISAVISKVPSWRAADLPVTHRVAITAALTDLLNAGTIMELSDGVEFFYGLPPRHRTGGY